MTKRIRVTTATISRPFTIAKYGVDFEGEITLTEDEWELMTDQRLDALQMAAFTAAHPDAKPSKVQPTSGGGTPRPPKPE